MKFAIDRYLTGRRSWSATAVLMLACCVAAIVTAEAGVMVVMDVFTRRIVGFGVEPAHIDGISVCRMFNQARCAQPLPKRLSTDHDPLFRFDRWRANLRVLDIEELKSIPFVPRSHPFIERLIGTLRREYLNISTRPSFGTASTSIAS